LTTSSGSPLRVALVAFAKPAASKIRTSIDAVHAGWSKLPVGAVVTCRHDIVVSSGSSYAIHRVACPAVPSCAPDLLVIDSHGHVAGPRDSNQEYFLSAYMREPHPGVAVLQALAAWATPGPRALVVGSCEAGSRSGRRAAESVFGCLPYLACGGTSYEWQGPALYGALLCDLANRQPASPMEWRDAFDRALAHAEHLTTPDPNAWGSGVTDPLLHALLLRARGLSPGRDLKLRHALWRSWSATLAPDA